MSGATFLLAVNFIVAACFSAVFAVVATHSRSRVSALWIAAGFGVASLSAICEILVAYTSLDKLWAISAFMTVLIGMVLLHVGISGLYHRRVDWRIAASFTGTSAVLAYAIYDLPRGTPLQAFLYQSPFAVVLLSAGFNVLKARAGTGIDRFLGVLLLFTGMHFFAKAELAVIFGSGTTAKDYVQTNYALISQSTTAVLVVGVGLTLLATLVLGIMADQRDEAEKDSLSGLPNRRAFERAVQRLLKTAPDGEHALILCDLDHFKRINDNYGHLVGDHAIKSFGDLLLNSVPSHGLVGRIGGEEFAIVLPNVDVETALLLAQAVRAATTTMPYVPDDLHVTGSFGISRLTSAAGLTEAYKQADAALYSAKKAGRNRVKIAVSSHEDRVDQPTSGRADI
jgi:diguanylate cyclase (GGDEF)-like protein